jgi:hypothetical protein
MLAYLSADRPIGWMKIMRCLYGRCSVKGMVLNLVRELCYGLLI